MPTKVRLVKAMVLLVVIYGCESWTIKKAELSIKGRTAALKLALEKTLNSPLDFKGLQGDQTRVRG